MTHPRDIQSYSSASSAGAAREEKEENTSKWEEIEDEDDNMLVKLEWARLKREFFDYLQDQTHTIQSIAS